MTYKKTKRISLREYTRLPNAPQSAQELIRREVNKESMADTTLDIKPATIDYIASGESLKKSAGLLNFYKSNVSRFFLAFKP